MVRAVPNRTAVQSTIGHGPYDSSTASTRQRTADKSKPYGTAVLDRNTTLSYLVRQYGTVCGTHGQVRYGSGFTVLNLCPPFEGFPLEPLETPILDRHLGPCVSRSHCCGGHLRDEDEASLAIDGVDDARLHEQNAQGFPPGASRNGKT